MNKLTFLVFAVALFFSANTNAQDIQEFGKIYTLKEIINIGIDDKEQLLKYCQAAIDCL